MKKLTTLVFLLIFLSACNPFRHVFKSGANIKTFEVRASESELKTQSSLQDKSIINTVTNTKKIVEVPNFKGEQKVRLEDDALRQMIKGLSIYRDSILSVYIQLDSGTNQLQTFVEGKGGKITEESTTTETTNSDVNLQENKQKKKKMKEEEKKKEKVKESQSEPLKVNWFALFSVSLILVFIYFSYKKSKNG